MSRSTLFAHLLLPLFCALPLAAQESPSDRQYAALLERVRANDTTVDFNDLRLSYAATAAYAPDSEDQNVQVRMRDALAAKDFRKALAHADTLLATNYLGIEAHYVGLVANQELAGRNRATIMAGWSTGCCAPSWNREMAPPRRAPSW